MVGYYCLRATNTVLTGIMEKNNQTYDLWGMLSLIYVQQTPYCLFNLAAVEDMASMSNYTPFV